MTTPVKGKERIVELDVIRGFALFGVLLVNMTLFKSTDFYVSKAPGDFISPIDQGFAWLIQILASGNFYTIFSFLFGLGFYIFMNRTREKGLSVKKLFIKRLLFLLGFGLLHLLFIWSGDILHRYSITGFFLFFFMRSSSEQIMKWTKRLLAFSLVAIFLVFLVQGLDYEVIEEDLVIDAQEEMAEEAPVVYREGSYLAILEFRFLRELPFISLNLLLAIPTLLTLFLMGFYVGEKEYYKDLSKRLRDVRQVFYRSLVIALPLKALYAAVLGGFIPVPMVIRFSLLEVLDYASGIAMCFVYMTGVVLLMNKKGVMSLLYPFHYVGKMALTNYLAQSLVAIMIFYGFGLGLFGSVRLWWGVLLTVLIFAAQIFTSKLWLAYYQFGPMEWIWRNLTYGKRFPLRKG